MNKEKIPYRGLTMMQYFDLYLRDGTEWIPENIKERIRIKLIRDNKNGTFKRIS